MKVLFTQGSIYDVEARDLQETQYQPVTSVFPAITKRSGIEGLKSKVFIYNAPYISGSLCYYHVMVVIVELTCSRSGV